MILLKKFEVQGFKLLDDASISFDNRKGIVTVIGDNKDFYDSNSSGKTTLPNAICQTIFGKNLDNMPQHRCFNTYTKTKFRGIIEIQVNDNTLIIDRSYQSDTLTFWVNNEVCTFKKKTDIQNEIDKYLGMSFETFSKLFYLSPSKLSLFAVPDAEAQKRFMTELLGLDFVDKIFKRTKKDIDEYEAEIGNLTRELNDCNKQMERLQDQLLNAPIYKKVEESSLIPYQSQGFELKDEIKSLESLRKKIIEEIQKLRTQKDTLVGKVSIIEENEKEKNFLLSKDICPTCNQSLDGVKSSFEGNLTELTEMKEEIQNIVTEVTKKTSEKNSIEAKIQKAKGKLNETQTKIGIIEEALKANTDYEKFDRIKTSLEQELTEQTMKMLKTKQELNKFDDYVYVHKLIREACGKNGFIKERITLFIKLLNAHLRELCLHLLGTEFFAVIEIDDKNNFIMKVRDKGAVMYYQDLSSGFQRRVDILLNLALNLSVEELTGEHINMLFLDEILGNIDDSGRTDVEEMLLKVQQKFPEKIIFVILHGGTLRADNSLKLTREHNKTTLAWV